MKKLVTTKKFVLVLSVAFTSFQSNAQWETLPDIPEDLVFPVAAVIGDNIHVINRYNNETDVCPHFRFSTVTETWDTLAPLPYSSVMMAGDAVNGKLHIFGGGYPNSGSPVSDHYSYDPQTDSWSAEIDLTPARAIHYGKTIGDSVYSIAGQGVTSSLELYNPSTQTWESRANLPTTNFAYSALAVSNDKLYRFGGGGYSVPSNFVHVYDPQNDSWSNLSNLSDPLHGPAATGLEGSDEIYIVGGYHSFDQRDEVWIYNTVDETYTAGPDLPIGRDYHVAVTVNDCIYSIAGHHAIDETVGTSLLRYCPLTASTIKLEETGLDFKVTSSNDQINVTANDTEGSDWNIVVVDSQGKILYENKTNQNDLFISTKDWSASIAFVKIEFQGNQMSEKVLIVH